MQALALLLLIPIPITHPYNLLFYEWFTDIVFYVTLIQGLLHTGLRIMCK